MPHAIDILRLYYSPATPDLGCFVRNKHGFQVDGDFFIWNEYPPFDPATGRILPHQVYFRVKCGKAAHHQRVSVWMTPPGTSLPPPLIGQPPDYVLGGDFAAMPSGWLKFPVRTTDQGYWFAGEHKPANGTSWLRDFSVGHSYDIYDNGTLSTVGWDDTGEDRDYDDFILEVAVVRRHFYFPDLSGIALTADEVARFERDIMPKRQASRAKLEAAE
jgi:hypothetical protein